MTPESGESARPAGEDQPQPGREEVEVTEEEGGHGVSVVRPVLLSLTQPV